MDVANLRFLVELVSPFFCDQKKQKSCPVNLADHFFALEKLKSAKLATHLVFQVQLFGYRNLSLNVKPCFGSYSADFLTFFKGKKMARLKGRISHSNCYKFSVFLNH